jgi:alkylation response protein AidB-like acyl-CoA dehydrogenase
MAATISFLSMFVRPSCFTKTIPDVLMDRDGGSHGYLVRGCARWFRSSLSNPMIVKFNPSTADLEIDRSWWHPLGMRASGSHVVNFQATVVTDEQLIGAPDDYLKEPWFSGGAIRFAAVHVGGMHAVLDVAVAHLNETGRAKNPHQQHRLGEMGISAGAGYAWLDHAAKVWSEIGSISDKEVIASLSAARLAIERSALDVLEFAERSVGAPE